MMRQKKTCIAPRLAVPILLVFAAFCGCDKKPQPASAPQPPPSRAKDPAYLAQLNAVQNEKVKVASSRAKIEAELERWRARAKAVLGASATLEQIDAELTAHPEKYPGWNALKARLAENDGLRKQVLDKARATVRDRILKDGAGREAVPAAK